jgi:enoyl-CoA hydratase
VSEPVLLVEAGDGVATVTLNRPEARNALSRELVRTLSQAMVELDGRDDVDVVILTGADPAFCAGVDLKELAAGGSPLNRGGDGDAGDDGPRRRTPVSGMTKPLIGAVNGVAITGGLELALNCDFLVASERARFADTHARVGVMPGWGLTVLLPQAVGIRKAREMSFTGNFVGADEALRIGLVNHVVPHDELVPFTRSLAADMVSNDQRSMRRLRQEYDLVTSTTVEHGWELEAELAREWQGRGIDSESVAARRQSIVERGRAQQRGS